MKYPEYFPLIPRGMKKNCHLEKTQRHKAKLRSTRMSKKKFKVF